MLLGLAYGWPIKVKKKVRLVCYAEGATVLIVALYYSQTVKDSEMALLQLDLSRLDLGRTIDFNGCGKA